MSASIIRRGLELLSDDIKDAKKAKQGQAKKHQTPSKAKAMALVSTGRQGVTKQVKLLQGRRGPGKSKATVKDKRIKSAIEEFKKKHRQSHLSSNLRYFLGSSYKAKDAITMKILHQNKGRLSRNNPERPAKKPAAPSSLFTEEEFQKFQREYFGKDEK